AKFAAMVPVTYTTLALNFCSKAGSTRSFMFFSCVPPKPRRTTSRGAAGATAEAASRATATAATARPRNRDGVMAPPGSAPGLGHDARGDLGVDEVLVAVRPGDEAAVEEDAVQVVVAGPAQDRIARPRALPEIAVDDALAEAGVDVR